MIELLCYRVYSGFPEDEEPMGYCVMGEGKLWFGETLDEAQSQAENEYPDAEFLDDCGWVIEGEEESLLNPDYRELLAYNINLNYPPPKINNEGY